MILEEISIWFNLDHLLIIFLLPKIMTGNPLQYSCLENPMGGGAQ